MPTHRTTDDLRDLVAPVVGALGYRLYDVEINGSGRSRTVRVLVDRDGGVDLDAITAVTHAVSPALDDAPFLAGPFLLEVSSPGLERPLRRPEHWAGAIGSLVTVALHTDAGPRRVRGVLEEAGAERAVIIEDGAQAEVPYAAVTSARTVFEWGPAPKTTTKTKRGAPKRSTARPPESGQVERRRGQEVP